LNIREFVREFMKKGLSEFVAEPIRWLFSDSGFMMNRQMISAHKIEIVIMMVLSS